MADEHRKGRDFFGIASARRRTSASAERSAARKSAAPPLASMSATTRAPLSAIAAMCQQARIGLPELARCCKPNRQTRTGRWFAPDSALEEAVSSEPVSRSPKSLLVGSLQGLSSIRGSAAGQWQQKKASHQILTSQFPTHQNREFLAGLAGNLNWRSGRFLP